LNFLNYLYFFIITGLGVKFLFQSKGLIKNPLHRRQYMVLTGPEMFLILTFSTGLLAFSSSAGSFDLMAIRLLALEIMCLIGLSKSEHKPVWSLSVWAYLFYLIWLTIGLSYTPSIFYGFRVILKYLYPFLIMLLASAVVRDKEVFLTAGLGAQIVALISIIFSFVPFIGALVPGVFWYVTAEAIHYISMAMFSLALFYYGGKNKRYLLFSGLFMLPCFLWVFRTSMMGTALALAAFFFFRYKLKSLPYIAGVALLLIGIVFTVPNVKKKMFFKEEEKDIAQLQTGEITRGDIKDNGRFAMWDDLMERFYHNKEIVGSGTGSTQNYFYSNFVFGGLKVAHSDYIQMLCDTGLIGLVLYLLAAFLAIVHSFFEFNKKDASIPVKMCAIVAGSSLAGLLLTMYSDNDVNYSMATLSYPFGFYGMMLGLIKGKK